MSIKQKILPWAGTFIQKFFFSKPKKVKDDGRADHAFNLVFFCGARGIDYLNAAIYSVYKTWKQLPNIIILTDGTPAAVIQKKLIQWPKKVEIIPWETSASYYRDKGNTDLYNYAANELWGKKFVGILYCAEKGKVLYSDTDVLWYKDPIDLIKDQNSPFIQMSQEAGEHAYSIPMLDELKENDLLHKEPLNAGVIYVNGDFSSFPKWTSFCSFLAQKPDFRTEQTGFAILTHYFGTPWDTKQVVLQIDDKTELTLKKYKQYYKTMCARHYVDTKPWLFWRDYFLYFK